MKDEKKHKNY